MATILEQRLVKARKDDKCDACEVWRERPEMIELCLRNEFYPED